MSTCKIIYKGKTMSVENGEKASDLHREIEQQLDHPYIKKWGKKLFLKKGAENLGKDLVDRLNRKYGDAIKLIGNRISINASDIAPLYEREIPMEEAMTQADKLTHIFAQNGIDLNVVVDNTIEGNAEIQGNEIRLKKPLSDTVPHEFAHAYVDLLGYNSTIVQSGIKILEGTELDKSIRENPKYSHLSKEQLDKEVLVTAIGQKYAEFDNLPRWKRWLNRFIFKLGKVFGIKKNAVVSLMEDMYYGELKPFKGQLSNEIQRQATTDMNIDQRIRQKIIDIQAAFNRKVKELDHSSNRGRASFGRELQTIATQDLANVDQVRGLLVALAKANTSVKRYTGDGTTSNPGFINVWMQDLVNIRSLPDDQKREQLKGLLSKLGHAEDDISTFKTLSEIYPLLEGLPIPGGALGVVFDREWYRENISPIIEAMDQVMIDYEAVAIEYMGELLYTYNQDPNLSRQDITDMLQGVTQDITKISAWWDDLASSQETTLALVDRMIKDQKNAINREMFDFIDTEWKQAIQDLEQYQRSQGRNIQNNNQLFDFMIEMQTDPNNVNNEVPSGRYVHPDVYLNRIGRNTDDPRYKFLKIFHDRYQEAQAMIPASQQKGLELPTFLKSDMELAVENKSLRSVGTAIQRKFVRQTDDTGYTQEVITNQHGEQVKFAPTNFTARVSWVDSDITPDMLSMDMSSNLVQFMTMARNYKAMSGIMTEVNAIKHLVAKRDVEQDKLDIGSRVIDAVTGNERPGTGEPLKIKGVHSNTYTALIEYLNSHVYGEFKVDHGTIGATNIDIQKATDFLKSYTSWNALALNLYSGINNTVIGTFMNAIESNSSQFFSKRDYASAKKEYMRLLPQFVDDATRRFTESKMGKFFERYDVFQEFDEFGNKLEENSYAKRMLSKAGFFLQSSGEHMIQSTHAIAILKHHRIHNGQVYSFDRYMDEVHPNVEFKSKEEKRILDEEFNNLPTVYDSIQEDQTVTGLDENAVQNLAERIKGNYQYLHGNYAKQDSVAMNRYWIGKLFLIFRKWLKPGWNRRYRGMEFGSKIIRDANGNIQLDPETGRPMREQLASFDQRMGANTAGFYVVAFNFFRQLARDFRTMGTRAFIYKNTTHYQNLPRWQKQQIEKFEAEMVAILGMVTTTFAIGAYMEADDEEGFKKWVLQMAAYQAHRVRKELSFYNTGMVSGEFMDIIRTPSASLSSAEKLARVLEDLALMPFMPFTEDPLTDASYYYQSGKKKGDLKLQHHAYDMIPLMNQISRLWEVDTQLKWMSK